MGLLGLDANTVNSPVTEGYAEKKSKFKILHSQTFYEVNSCFQWQKPEESVSETDGCW